MALTLDITCFVRSGIVLTAATCILWGTADAAGQGWQQTLELWADDAAPGDYFGFSVSISEGILLAGAYQNDDDGMNSGSAYLLDATTGEQLHTLRPMDGGAGDLFGVNVSIHGDVCIVGAQNDDEAGANAGAAYLFDVKTGQRLHKLLAEDATPGDRFGNPVAIGDGIALVGAFRAGLDSGAAYVFDVTTGAQLCKLTAAGDHFGRSIALHGSTAIIGANWADAAGAESGTAYIFDLTTCEQVHELSPEDGAPLDHFGISVGIDGDWAVVGAHDDDAAGNDSGSVYVFDLATGMQVRKIVPADGSPFDGFGREVDIENGLLLVGSHLDDVIVNDAGSAYLFDATTGNELCKLTASDAGAADRLGRSVALDGTTVVVGAHLHDHAAFDAGAVFVFEETTCPADVNDDGAVTVADLIAVIVDWGCTGEPGSCDADINLDGVVDVLDLVEVVVSWGACS